MAAITTDIIRAADLLRASELVAIPTETVYGLAGNALDLDAVAKIFEVKARPRFDPLIVHTHSLDAIRDLVDEIPEAMEKLAAAYMPGPVSILLSRKDGIPDLVTSGLAKVAIRIPSHPLTHQLLQLLTFPLAAPSANPFGYISPTTSAHVQAQLGDKIDLILEGELSEVGVESTVVDFQDGKFVILRQGAVTSEMLESLGHEVKTMTASTSNPSSPGQLTSHYAPRIPLSLESLDQLLGRYDAERIGFLAFRQKDARVPEENQRWLSPKNSVREAAKNLFSHLRELDAMDLDVIAAELVPEEGIGRAINDKLQRAQG